MRTLLVRSERNPDWYIQMTNADVVTAEVIKEVVVTAKIDSGDHAVNLEGDALDLPVADAFRWLNIIGDDPDGVHRHVTLEFLKIKEVIPNVSLADF